MMAVLAVILAMVMIMEWLRGNRDDCEVDMDMDLE